MIKTVKYLFAFLISAMLIISLPTAMASETDVGGLTMEELDAWAGKILEQALNSQPVSQTGLGQKSEDGYAHVFDFATLYTDAPELTRDSVVNAITVNELNEDFVRDISMFDSQQTLLSAYVNENPTLLGDRDFAVLYLSDNLPEEVLWGRVHRDGQRILSVQYAVHQQVPGSEGEYTDSGILYSLDNGYVIGIRVYGLSASIDLEETLKIADEVASQQQEESYFAYPQSIIGTDLDPFEREDLFFSGLDYFSLTPQDAIDTLGAFDTETWLEDDTGDWMRIMQWPVAEITFAYDKNKNFKRTDTLALFEEGLEGPRGVMVGDSLSSVMMRYRHGEGEYDGESSEILYGDGQIPPFGRAEYADSTVTLHYAFPVSGIDGIENVTMYMMFVDTYLSELLIYPW